MKRNQIAWWMWGVGTVLVVLSWFDVVSTNIGWCGFALGLVASAISWDFVHPLSDHRRRKVRA